MVGIYILKTAQINAEPANNYRHIPFFVIDTMRTFAFYHEAQDRSRDIETASPNARVDPILPIREDELVIQPRTPTNEDDMNEYLQELCLLSIDSLQRCNVCGKKGNEVSLLQQCDKCIRLVCNECWLPANTHLDLQERQICKRCGGEGPCTPQIEFRCVQCENSNRTIIKTNKSQRKCTLCFKQL